MSAGMVPGQKCRVIFRGPRLDREMVARFIGETGGVFSFDLRLLAGTQTLRRVDIRYERKTRRYG